MSINKALDKHLNTVVHLHTTWPLKIKGRLLSTDME